MDGADVPQGERTFQSACEIGNVLQFIPYKVSHIILIDAVNVMLQENYLQVIREAYPDLHITSIELYEQGQNSAVLVVNRELIFRFPKYMDGLASLRRETCILNGIQGVVPLAVPAPLFVNLDREVGEAFLGYRMIPGEPLWRKTVQKIKDQRVVRSLAGQLTGFLKALHGTVVDESVMGEPPVDTYEACADLYSRIRGKLFPYMRPDARAWAAKHFEDYLIDGNNFEYQPVLKHGDFGPSNILFDRQAGKITGIIDFSGSGMGDPAYDFAGLLSGYGERFVEYCTDCYPQVESFIPRVRFYKGTFALLEALFGIENGDEDALWAGLERYV